MSKSDNEYIHLKNCLQNNLPLPSKDYPNNIVSMSVGSSRGKQIIINNIWLKRLTRPQTGPKQISDMLFEIGYINRQGETESSKRTICGEEFESIIHVMKFCNKKTFIYDATATQMDTTDQEDSVFTQTSVHSIKMNNSLFPNFNQSLFGRQSTINVPLNNSNYHTQDYSLDGDRYLSM